MLARKATIRKAIEAAEMSLLMTKSNIRGYDDSELAIIRRIEALQFLLNTGRPDIDIIKEYPLQESFYYENVGL